MTSDPVSFERRVHVGLIGSEQQNINHVRPAGLLKVTRRGVIESGELAYGRRYLNEASALPLNPETLPLQDTIFMLKERRIRDGGAMPLTLRDALPDSWGRTVLEVQQGGSLTDIDALLLTNEDRVGAMVFSETLPITTDAPATRLLSLEELAEASRRSEAGLEVTPRMQQLLRGGSLGETRPKATFIHNDRRHIAKFSSRGDDHDVEVVEATTLSMARECGVTVPLFHLQPLKQGHVLLVRRFDRDGPTANERRLHYLSSSALLDVPYESSGGSYVELAQVLRRRSWQPEVDLPELFRRMVFNLVVGNSDDHVKNHGMLMMDLAGGDSRPRSIWCRN